MHKVVVEDTSGELALGTVINGPNRLARYAKRVVMLPVDPNRAYGDITGFFIRHWGEGWLFNRNVGERGCPMTVDVVSDQPNLYWAARVEAVPGIGVRPLGSLRLTADSSRGRGIAGGLSSVHRPEPIEALGPPDLKGGWILRGRSTLSSGSGLLSLSLYGVCRGLLVKWSAISQSPEDVPLE